MVIKNNENNRSLPCRYLDGLYIAGDARRLLDELQTLEYNTDMFRELMDEVWEETSLQPPQTDLERERCKEGAQLLLKCTEHKRRMWFRRVSLTVTNAAAVVCLILGSVSYIRYINRQQITYLETPTSYSERKEIRLPDDTQLILNSCSRVHYPDRFVDEEHRVELEGERYFHVYHNKKQPFIVNIRHFDVCVLGAYFNVKSYSLDEVVSVDVENDKAQVDLPETMIRLRAKERILTNTVLGGYDKQREERAVAVWRRGSLHFNSTPIRDVTRGLGRMYSCRIIFTQGQELNNLISGEHGNKSLEAVLQLIDCTSGIHYKRSGDQVLLYK